MHSCLYVGPVSHQRLKPTLHGFSYELALLYLDLAETTEVMALPWLSERWGAQQFRRSDHIGDSTQPLSTSVREWVAERSDVPVTGPIRLLTALANFGHRFNPLSLFYCFDAADQKLEFVVAEVTNTPWGERHHYLLDVRDGDNPQRLALEHSKEFHVSPFMPLNMRYHWLLSTPDETLRLTLANSIEGDRLFTANMTMQRHALGAESIRRQLLGRPLQSFRISAAIYWQALKLWRKKTPYYSHPGSNTEISREQHKIH